MVGKRPILAWEARKLFESNCTYEEFVHKMSNMSTIGPGYYIISGVNNGVVIAKNPDYVEHFNYLPNGTNKFIV